MTYHSGSGVTHHTSAATTCSCRLYHLGHAIDRHHLILQVVLVGIEFLLNIVMLSRLFFQWLVVSGQWSDSA